MAKFPFSFL